MPLYDDQCDDCGSRFEVIQKYSDPPVATCTSCGGPVKKLLSSPAIQFKGTGWYITDYARKGNSGASAANSGSSEGQSSDGKSAEGKASDGKASEGKSSEGKSSADTTSSTTQTTTSSSSTSSGHSS